MKIKINKELVKLADKAIKVRIEECGDYTEKDVFLARIIFNMCFNPVELERSKKLLKKMLERKDPSKIIPSAIKIK